MKAVTEPSSPPPWGVCGGSAVWMLGTSKTRCPVNIGTSVRKIWFLFVCFLRLHEFDEQVAAVREGMARVVPVPLLSLFTGYELETMVRAALCCLKLLGMLAHSLFDPGLKPLHLERLDYDSK